MLHFFRSFMNSKVGVIITLAFLVVIAIAFAVGDVTSTGTFTGLSSSNQVAVVGKRKISMDELETATRSAFDNARQNNPTLTMAQFVAGGGLDQTLDNLLQATAVSEYAQQNGLHVGGRLSDSELVKVPVFAGVDGKFSEDAYRAFLQQRGLTDGQVREDIANALYWRQTIDPVLAPGGLPDPLVKRYIALLTARRHGEIGLLTSDAYAPKEDPTDAQLNAFYNRNRTAYLRPERRVIQYAAFGGEALKNVPAPTEAEIAARFSRDSALYTASEKRSLSQLVLPTEAAAKAIAAEVAKGKSLAAAAGEKGLAVAAITPVEKTALATQTSPAVANAVFAAGQGQLTAPTRGGLGWYLMRVEAIQKTPARTLDQVRGEITSQLAVEKRNAALADMTARIEEEFDNGSSLADVAKELGIKIEATPEVVATGQVYANPTQKAPEILARVLSTAFEMDEGEPQLAEIDPGKTFLVFDVSSVTAASPAPLKDIREAVVTGWRRSEGDKKAKTAADRVMKAVQGGQTVAAAMAKEGVAQLPPPDKINMNREELGKLGKVPPVMALMFSMAEGTVKRLEAPNDNGWFVVKLDDIEPGALAKDDPRIAIASKELAQTSAQEYGEQMAKAAAKEVGVKKNKDAIEAVRKRLIGGN